MKLTILYIASTLLFSSAFAEKPIQYCRVSNTAKIHDGSDTRPQEDMMSGEAYKPVIPGIDDAASSGGMNELPEPERQNEIRDSSTAITPPILPSGENNPSGSKPVQYCRITTSAHSAAPEGVYPTRPDPSSDMATETEPSNQGQDAAAREVSMGSDSFLPSGEASDALGGSTAPVSQPSDINVEDSRGLVSEHAITNEVSNAGLLAPAIVGGQGMGAMPNTVAPVQSAPVSNGDSAIGSNAESYPPSGPPQASFEVLPGEEQTVPVGSDTVTNSEVPEAQMPVAPATDSTSQIPISSDTAMVPVDSQTQTPPPSEGNNEQAATPPADGQVAVAAVPVAVVPPVGVEVPSSAAATTEVPLPDAQTQQPIEGSNENTTETQTEPVVENNQVPVEQNSTNASETPSNSTETPTEGQNDAEIPSSTITILAADQSRLYAQWNGGYYILELSTLKVYQASDSTFSQPVEADEETSAAFIRDVNSQAENIQTQVTAIASQNNPQTQNNTEPAQVPASSPPPANTTDSVAPQRLLPAPVPFYIGENNYVFALGKFQQLKENQNPVEVASTQILNEAKDIAQKILVSQDFTFENSKTNKKFIIQQGSFYEVDSDGKTQPASSLTDDDVLAFVVAFYTTLESNSTYQQFLAQNGAASSPPPANGTDSTPSTPASATPLPVGFPMDGKVYIHNKNKGTFFEYQNGQYVSAEQTSAMAESAKKAEAILLSAGNSFQFTVPSSGITYSYEGGSIYQLDSNGGKQQVTSFKPEMMSQFTVTFASILKSKGFEQKMTEYLAKNSQNGTSTAQNADTEATQGALKVFFFGNTNVTYMLTNDGKAYTLSEDGKMEPTQLSAEYLTGAKELMKKETEFPCNVSSTNKCVEQGATIYTVDGSGQRTEFKGPQDKIVELAFAAFQQRAKNKLAQSG